jgi:Predicted phosphatases
LGSTMHLNFQGRAVPEKQKIYVVYGGSIPKRTVVVFDIDGVLVDCSERLEKSLEEVGATKDDLEHSPEARRRFWRVFLSEKYMHLDRPVDAAVELLRERRKSYGVVIVTGRPKTLLKPTIKQLEDFGIPFDAVVFRAQGYTARITSIRSLL